MQIDDKWRYIADTGSQCVVPLDTTSGTVTSTTSKPDPVPVDVMQDATFENFVTSAPDLPNGLAVHDGVLFVSDFDNATIQDYDLGGAELGAIDLSGVASSVTGLAVGPMGWLYFADMHSQTVYRLVPTP